METIALKKLTESPLNPRRRFDDVRELAASIREHGVLQPLVVRPVPGHRGRYELVFGHRRLRAAKEAGLDVVPVLIRQMDDRQVLEAQIAENNQRSDIHPLEEADALRQLAEQFKVPVAELVARTGRSEGFVRSRLRLAALGESARAAFLDGKLTAGVALLIARLPVQSQEEALAYATAPRWAGGPLPKLADVHAYLTDRLMRRLTDAPFPIADAKLLPVAGACTTCPNRTGNQGVLFTEVEDDDCCTFAECWRSKIDAQWAREKKQAKKAGFRVLTDEEREAAKVFPYANGDYVKLDEEVWVGEGRRPWAEIVGDALPVVLARDPETGVPERLVEAAAAEKLRLKLLDAGRESEDGEGGDNQEEKRGPAEWEVRRAVDDRIEARIRKLWDESWQDLSVTALLSLLLVREVDYAGGDIEVPELRPPEDVLYEDHASWQLNRLRALDTEGVCRAAAQLVASQPGEEMRRAIAGVMGVEIEQLERDIEREVRQELGAPANEESSKPEAASVEGDPREDLGDDDVPAPDPTPKKKSGKKAKATGASDAG